jgi:hypothetical protein
MKTKHSEISLGNQKIQLFQNRHPVDDLEPVQYNRSWDKLYPILEQIQDLGYTVHMGPVSCEILDGDKTIHRQDIQEMRLYGTWLTVTKFIDYYNLNGK